MASGITPSRNVLEPPFTPPPTEHKPLSRSAQSVVTYLRLHRANHRPSSWWEIRLKPDGYLEVLGVLDADENLRGYVEDKIRYDYDPRRCCLTIRMPSPVHDTFCARIADEILKQLSQLQETDGLTANFAKQIQHFATSRILIPEDTHDGKHTFSKREPDASFGHWQALYPGVILEVCYSRKSKRISYLADDYILNTDGSVNVVIALYIDYQGSREATITTWRPEYATVNGVEEFRAAVAIEAQPFRTNSGLATEGTALRLRLRDFATEDLSRGQVGLHREILITSKQLCDFLSCAEARQQMQTQQQCSIDRIRPGALKRRRPQTPPEQLSSDNEGSVGRGKKGKYGGQRGDFRPSSSSGDSKGELH
ncbi:unnamed protein product [Penicillium olsonii]|nr:unnamed protein product [Penicillium olsonii]